MFGFPNHKKKIHMNLLCRLHWRWIRAVNLTKRLLISCINVSPQKVINFSHCIVHRFWQLFDRAIYALCLSFSTPLALFNKTIGIVPYLRHAYGHFVDIINNQANSMFFYIKFMSMYGRFNIRKMHFAWVWSEHDWDIIKNAEIQCPFLPETVCFCFQAASVWNSVWLLNFQQLFLHFIADC